MAGQDINDFIRGLDVEGRTKKNYRQTINVLVQFARKQKYLPRDHAVMDEVEEAAEADFEIEIFTPDEVARLLKHASGDLLPVLAIGAFAGFADFEERTADWQDVKFDAGCVVVEGKSENEARSGAADCADAAESQAMAEKCGKETGRFGRTSSRTCLNCRRRRLRMRKCRGSTMRCGIRSSVRVAKTRMWTRWRWKRAIRGDDIPALPGLVSGLVGKWFGNQPAKRKGGGRKSKAVRRGPKMEPENVISMPKAVAA